MCHNPFFITLNQLYSIQSKWISICFFIIFVLTFVTSIYVSPIRCSMTNISNVITSDQLNDKCYEELNDIKSYKLSNTALYILSGASTILYLLLQPLFDERKPRISRFKWKNIVLSNLNLVKRDPKLFTVNLLHHSIQNSNISTLFFAYLIYLYAYPILIFANLNYLILNQRFTIIGYKFITNPFKQNLDDFPRTVNCKLVSSNGINISTDCNLNLNELYEIIYIFLWFILIIISLANTICLIEMLLLKSFKCLRRNRIEYLLGNLIYDEITLNRLSDNYEIIFTIESLIGRLKAKDFYRLMTLFIKDYSYNNKKSKK